MLDLKVPAIEKLLDYLASGIGAIAGSMLAPWRASKEGQARINAANADAEVHRIEAESDAQALQIIADAQVKARQFIETPIESGRGMMEITRGDITQRIEFQERKRLANVKTVIEDAANALDDKEVHNHEPDPDWTARFFDCVQDVSSEDMQKIWARILSGEVERPGGTSLRTLETLRNMTKRDAELFQGICDFVIDGDFVFHDENSADNFDDLKYNNLLHLQDCGLVNVVPSLVKRWQWSGQEEQGNIVFSYQNGALLVTRSQKTNGTLEIPEILLTTAGRELFRVSECTFQMGYLQALSKFLQSNNCQLFYIEGIKELSDDRIAYTSRTPIEPQSEQLDRSTP